MDVICMAYLFQLGFIKQRVGEVDRGFKESTVRILSLAVLKIVQFWKLQLQDLVAN